MGSSTGWTKYGVLKKESIGDNYKFRYSWNRLTNDNYKSGNFLLHRLFLEAFGLFKKLISFSYTYAPIDNLDSLELARAIYLRDLQKENSLVKNSIIKSYISNPELMKSSEFLLNVGRVANKQSQDITTADQIVINELSIRLMTVINPLERDVNMTLRKALDHIGSWYVNNIFTYQGSEQTVKKIEDGTAPSKVKLYVNCTNPDFDLLEGTPTYQIDTIENPDGTLQYNLPQFKFGAVWNLTIIVPTCIDSDHSKIYYIGFEGIATKKKRVAAINCQVEFFNSNKVPGLDEDRKTEKIGQI
jgi:hypothetical protein